MRHIAGVMLMAALVAVPLAHAQQPPPPPPMPGLPGMPQRDAAAAKTGTAVLRGTVLSAETGKPLRRAQVRAQGGDPRDARSVSTDENGVWELKELPAGRYAIQVSKGGYVTLAHGQRRPFEQGRPIVLADGQTIEKIDIALPRGGVIAGQLYDEFGEPVAGARVVAMRYRFLGGQRRLVPFAGTGSTNSTDDIGQFRLHGLPPGDYYLSASFGTSMAFDRSEDRTGYAPTFYPGTPVLAEAQKVSVAQAQELLGVTFALTPIRVATVSGTVTNASGKPLPNTMVMLTSDTAVTMSPLSGGSMTRADGTFTISNVPPGDYRLMTQVMDLEAIARTGSTASANPSEFASLPITVTGEEIRGLMLTTAPAGTASGKVSFGGSDPAGLTSSTVAIVATAAQPGFVSIGGGAGRVKDDWTFELSGLSGRRIVRAQTSAPGWFLKSVTHEGVDVTDTGIDFAPGSSVSGVEVELTREMPSMTGTVEGPKNEALTDFVVVLFASDASKWGYLSRYVRTARPDQSGQFQVTGLPEGSYLAVALEYLEPGDEQDPEVLERLRGLATPVTVRGTRPTTVKLTRRSW